MDKSDQVHLELSSFPDAHVVDTYAVDSNNDQVTVLGTMGQDPDHRSPVHWRAWAIVALCALAAFQNTFYGIAPAANVSMIKRHLTSLLLTHFPSNTP